jgi:putative SOS response-associated peptidase YedK
MPVIIPRKDYDSWLNPEMLGQETFQSLMLPYPSNEMVFFPVNPKVNKATYENPDCIEPVLRAESDTQSHSSIG